MDIFNQIKGNTSATWVIVPVEHLNAQELDFLQSIRQTGDITRDYSNPFPQDVKPDPYGYLSQLLITHETGSWQPWKMKLLSDPKAFEAQKDKARNDPCSCGSGKKFKKCCGLKKVIGSTTHLSTPKKTLQ